MSFTTSMKVVLGLGVLLMFVTARAIQRSRRDPRLPPGPRGLPIVGNAHQLPNKKSYLKLKEWVAEYGDIYSLKIGSGTMIVLNTAEHVAELFDKRGAIYSSRPASYLTQELLAPNELHLLLMGYTPRWRQTRKIFMSLTSISVVDKLQPVQQAEATQMVKDMCETPEAFDKHIRRNATSVVLSSVFGRRGGSHNHPDVKEIYRVQDQFSEIVEPGNTPPVDVFPIFKYVPTFLAGWKQRAAAVRKGQRDLYVGLLRKNQARYAKGTRVNCLMDRLLSDESQEKHHIDEEHLAYIGGVMMEAGSDSTSATLLSFVLAILKYPEVLRKAQDEVDRICGEFHTPTFADMPHLPYVQACVHELLRWRTPSPGAFPHVLTQDDWYRGYFLPKGSMVVSNITAIHLNESDYDTPSQFVPERFLENQYGTKKTGASYEEKTRRNVYSFGAGRRVCPGQHMAENTLRINIAKMVWGLNFLPPIDPSTGVEVPASEIDVERATAYTDGVSSGPLPFNCRIVPRSAKHAEVLQQEYLEAHVVYDQYEKE